MANYTVKNVISPRFPTPNAEYYPQKGRLTPWSGKNLFGHASSSADLHTQTVHSIYLNSWLFLCTALFWIQRYLWLSWMRVLPCSVLPIFCNLYIFPNLLHYPKPLADFSDGGLFYTRYLQDVHRFLSPHAFQFPYIPNLRIQPHHLPNSTFVISTIPPTHYYKSFIFL